jgi:glycosyltransferase involved in cell wall biosynthesis
MEKIPLSVVIITKNEEANIADCLKSVSWADEIVVLDDNSADKTVEIARQYTDKVYSRKMDIEGRHRNYAYSLARNRWVLSLDADERVSPELADELRPFLAEEKHEFPAYSIPIRTYIGQRIIRYGGWYPAPKVRLFMKDKFKYEEAEVHPRVFIEGEYSGCLKNDIIHYSYKDFHDFFESLNNQTTLEARKWFKEKRKIGLPKTCRKFVDRFLKAYILKQGFRDGLLGFMVSYAGGLYQLLSYAKYWEMLQKEKGV